VDFDPEPSAHLKRRLRFVSSRAREALGEWSSSSDVFEDSARDGGAAIKRPAYCARGHEILPHKRAPHHLIKEVVY
jgi:hypothetical protein